MKNYVYRYLWCLTGVYFIAFGIVFVTKAALGTSPISGVPYVISLALPLSFGEWTFLLNFFFVILQVLILKKDFQAMQVLQVGVNLIFSGLIDFNVFVLQALNPESLWARGISLLIGCTILAFGIVLEVAPNVLVIPAEGLVKTICVRTKKPFGKVKILFDCSLILTAIVLSFLFFGEIRGLGIGTIISGLLVGKIVHFFNGHLPLVWKIHKLSQGVK